MVQNQDGKKSAPESDDVSGLPDPARLREWAPHLTPGQLESCEIYIRELLRFNKTLNLISPATASRVDAVHILDVVKAWALIEAKVPPGSTIFDFGTGNGLPGLLCAALSPDCNFKLIDRDQRKLEFCKHVAATLKLKNVVITNADVADLPKGSVKFAISRGFASVAKSLLLVRPVMAIGGIFFMMKGESWSLELAEMPPRLFGVWKSEMIGQYKLPDTPAEYVVLQSAKLTD